ncbi:MAG: HypC/HybG/HupF family hydrogenase formation chaperone [Nanoarchaeota archaeon]
MCLGVPGKIVHTDGDMATVDYEIEKRVGKMLSDDYSVGDWVIIQAGIVIDKIDEKEAKEALALYKTATCR